MLLLFALALAVPSGRGELLAAAVLAAAVWIGWDAVADDRPGPRARLVMAFSLTMLAALPALLLAFDRGLWIAPPALRGLNAGLFLWALGIAAIAVGSRAASISSRRRARMQVTPSQQRHSRTGIAAIAALVLVCLVAFVHEVGGPIAYFKNLNNSAAANAGLTYLIWGMSFAKYASFAHLGEAWAGPRRPSARVLIALALAFALLLLVGSRLLVLIALIQLLVLYAALRPIGRRFVRTLAVTILVGLVVFVGLGEYRRWENVTTHRPSFPSYLVNTSLPSLPKTYVNNYVDTVRSSVIVRRVVPAHAPYEHGKEFLRILLQPLPGSIRPTISTAPALHAAFTSGHGNGNALPVPVVGYIQFGLAGDVIFCLILGLAVGLVDRFGDLVGDVGQLLAMIGASTGLVIIFRGTLHNAIAFALIDVIGFYVSHRLLFAARSRETQTGDGVTSATGATVPARHSAPGATVA
jgi:hypothetical protein